MQQDTIVVVVRGERGTVKISRVLGLMYYISQKLKYILRKLISAPKNEDSMDNTFLSGRTIWNKTM